MQESQDVQVNQHRPMVHDLLPQKPLQRQLSQRVQARQAVLWASHGSHQRMEKKSMKNTNWMALGIVIGAAMIIMWLIGYYFGMVQQNDLWMRVLHP